MRISNPASAPVAIHTLYSQAFSSRGCARRRRRAGSKTDGERKGGTEKGREGGHRSCRFPRGRQADGVSPSLFATHPLETLSTALQKTGIWRFPLYLFLFQRFLLFFLTSVLSAIHLHTQMFCSASPPNCFLILPPLPLSNAEQIKHILRNASVRCQYLSHA